MSEKRRRTCGFRFFLTDAPILLAGGLGTWLLWPRIGEEVWLIPLVVGHFFLFCNVFRVRRSYELLWSAALLVNFGAWSILGPFSWTGFLLTQAPVTVGVIVAEVCSRRYHGLFCRSINAKHIEAWLSGEIDGQG